MRPSSPPLKIHTLSPSAVFLPTIAKGAMAMARDLGLALPDIRILLPTRRAARMMRPAFADLADQGALLMPRVSSLGDVDAEEMDLRFGLLSPQAASMLEDIPPALPPTRRLSLLTKFVMEKDADHQTIHQALPLARALARLMDQVYTEDLDFSRLDGLVPDQFADHWGITLGILQTLRTAWPEKLRDLGLIDASDRRNRLLKAQATLWQAFPPEMPIIAAGSTGSIPAASQLLRVIASLPRGCVILPGLDRDLDDAAWDNIGDTHPQAAMKSFLDAAGYHRADVSPWPYDPFVPDRIQIAREDLVRTILRPAETIEAWTSVRAQPADLEAALKDVSLIEAETAQDEARAISLTLREVLETPDQRAILITPDRDLARRVVAMMARWGVTVNDSAGFPLSEGLTGSYLIFLARVMKGMVDTVDFLTWVKHPLCGLEVDGETRSALIARIERHARRQGLTTIDRARLKAIDTEQGDIQAVFSCLPPPMESQTDRFSAWLRLHVMAAEKTASLENTPGAMRLWSGEAGEAASSCLSALMTETDDMPSMDFTDYVDVLCQFMGDKPVRPPHDSHPRITILGQIEARMMSSDVMILAGLNEGVWPKTPAADPWMSRPMRRQFGLPSPERSIGLAAHDVSLSLCAPRVVMTRRLREQGASTTPARWIERLKTYLKAQGVDSEHALSAPYMTWARMIDLPDHAPALSSAPMPMPDVAERPRDLWMTDIERWMTNPYRLYVEKILGLRPYDPLGADREGAQRGRVFHDVFFHFVRAHPDHMPDDALAILWQLAEDARQRHGIDDLAWLSAQPSTAHIFDGFLAYETKSRQERRFAAGEIEGAIQTGPQDHPFTVRARADRIDLTPEGEAVIIDYKTGQVPSFIAMGRGTAPQLGIEAMIAEDGGFEALGRRRVADLIHVKVTATFDAKPAENTKGRARDIIDSTRQGLQDLIAAFDMKTTPYLFLSRGLKSSGKAAIRHDERAIAHLGRLAEWSAAGNDSLGEDNSSDQAEDAA